MQNSASKTKVNSWWQLACNTITQLHHISAAVILCKYFRLSYLDMYAMFKNNIIQMK